MNLKFEKIVFSILFFLGSSFMFAQNLFPTNSSAPCWNCVPTGWTNNQGTPDISNRTNAAVASGGGGGATWTSTTTSTNSISLPLPPNAHQNWLSLRDLGPNLTEESVTTNITNLVAGRTYEVIAYSLTAVSNANGYTTATTNTTKYAGVYNDQYFFQIAGLNQSVASLTQNTWKTDRLRFTATAATEQLLLRPGNNANGGTSTAPNYPGFETIQLSLSLNAVNTIPVATSNSGTTQQGVATSINVVADDIEYDTGQTLTVDLNPSTAAVDNTFTVAGQGTWTVNSSGVVTFTPIATFVGTATIPYTVRDNFTLDTVVLPGISNTANISVMVGLDSDGDGVLDYLDLDDDNDGILDTAEDVCTTKVEGTPIFREDFGTGNTQITNQYVLGHTFTAVGPNDGSYTVTRSLDQNSTYTRTNRNNDLDAGYTTVGAGSNNGRYLMININSPTYNTAANPIFRIPNLSVSAGREHRFRIDLAGLLDVTPVTGGDIPNLQLTIRDSGGAILASGNSSTLGVLNDDIWRRLILNFTPTTSQITIEIANLQPNGSNGNDVGIDNIVLVPLVCDTDGDGIPNSLDLDSDNDGCLDAIEGAANFTNSQLVNAQLPLTVGTGSTAANQNLGNTVGNTATTLGVPTVAGTGQAIGTSQNATANECYIDAKNDITETPRNTAVSGSVLTNDIAIGLAMSSTALPTYLNASGVATAFVYGTPANVYSAAGVLAGSMTFNSNGTYTFTPTATFIGSVPVNYTAVSAGGFTDAASLEIKVVPNVNTYFNNPPIALNDNGITKINTNFTSSVLGNDSDPDGNAITVSAVNGVSANVGAGIVVAGVNSAGTTVANAGTLTLNAAGAYAFVPANNFVGTVNPVSYTISDGNGGVSSATLSIEVQAANTTPVVFASDDAKATPKGVAASGNILSNDTKTSAGTLSVQSATVNGAALTVNGTAQTIAGVGTLSINPSTGAYTFTPLANYVGTTPVVYTITDGLGNTSTATLYLTSLDSGFMDAKNDINQTPVNVSVSGTVLTNDASSSTPTVTSASQGGTPIALGTTAVQVSGVNAAGTTVANAGTLTLNSAGAYTFTPASGFVGTVTVDYVATNTIGNTDPAQLQIKVLPAVNSGGNNPPVALNDTGVTKTGINLSSNVLGNDSDPDLGNTITVTAVNGVAGNVGTAINVTGVNALGATVPAGTFTLNANGNYTYVPVATFTGTVNPISYTISDGNGGTGTATVNIEVKPTSTPPTVFANDDAKATLKGVPVSGTVLTNDTNSTGGAVTATQATINGVQYNLTAVPTVVVVPNVGTVTISSNGNYTFEPLATFVGTYAVPYTINNASSAVLYLTSLDGQSYCYRTPATPTSTTLQPVKHGITALNRAGTAAAEWPTVRQGAWTVLEARTKGFVVNRMEFAGGNPVGIPVANFIEGMMVYDTTNNCLKVYTSTDGGTTFAWYCMGTQTCPN